MRFRFVVAILALSLSVQTALAAMCATGCATMTAGTSHHSGDPAAKPAPEISNARHEHNGHQDASTGEQTQASAETEIPPFAKSWRKGGATTISALSAKCPLPESAKQRPRSTLELTFADASPSPLPLVSASGANHSLSLSVPPNLSPPARFTVLRI
ncbi:MAG: hypothetical protein ABIP12_00505 [Terriglobales bacterium]